jgi:DNA-binding response OmpR family regulator
MQKILIVEDNRVIVEIVACVLRRAGYEVSFAFDGVEALHHVEHHKPDLVILDLGLPKLPGEEVCREIRRNKKTSAIPIIMVTAKARDSDKVLGKVLGANHYITKPFDIGDLLKAVNTILAKNSPGNAGAIPSAQRHCQAS